MKRLIGLSAALGLLLMMALPVAAQGDKVTLCHATNSASNPFVEIQVDLSGNAQGHKADNGDFHVNAKTGGQDFLLPEGQETCDDVEDVPVAPVAPAVSAPTCIAPGMLTLTEVAGVEYTISPAYTAGMTGEFTVTAAAEEGFTLATGATTTFNVTVPAQLNCAAGAAPSVSAGTCLAPGALTLTAVTGVMYSVSPAYTAGATGTFTVTAAPAAGFTLTGPNVFVVNVPAQLVCNSGTQGSTGGPAAPPAPPVRTGTLAGTGGPGSVPNTATEQPSNQLVAIGALLLVASLGSIGAMQPAARRNRR